MWDVSWVIDGVCFNGFSYCSVGKRSVKSAWGTERCDLKESIVVVVFHIVVAGKRSTDLFKVQKCECDLNDREKDNILIVFCIVVSEKGP